MEGTSEMLFIPDLKKTNATVGSFIYTGTLMKVETELDAKYSQIHVVLK